MGWSGGNYTKGNAATGGWVGDASLGIGIEAWRHDTQDNDFATGIDQCLNKAGQNAMTGNLNLGGNYPVNLGAGTAAAPALCMNNDVNTGFFSPTADEIGVATNGTERIRIDASGNVGVGTTAPGANVDIQSTTGAQLVTRFSADTAASSINLRKSRGATVGANTIVQSGDEIGAIGFQGANGTGYTPAAAIYAHVDGTPGATNDMPGRLTFYTTADGAGATSERMRISNAGDVSVGTIAAIDRFNVTKDLNGYTGIATTNQDQVLRLQAYYQGGVGQWGSIQATTGAAVANNLALQPLGGNVGIGVTGPTYKLQLSTDSAGKPTTNTWTIVSDQRIKTNVQPYTKGLAEICQVKPITYDYNGKGGSPAGPGGVSILAQELQPVFPECIGSYKAKLNEDDAEETEILNYNGHAITFALINAIKELNAKVVALEAKVAALES